MDMDRSNPHAFAEAQTPMDSAPNDLVRFLRAPVETLPLDALCASFAHAILVLTVPAAGDLAGRGGRHGAAVSRPHRVLKTSASAQAIGGQPCPWNPPCALDLLFRTQGMITPGLEIPKPFVVSLEPSGPDLLVRCTLFGIAADWSGQIGEALVSAIRNNLRHPKGGRLDVSSRQTQWLGAVQEWQGVDGDCRIELDFITPFVLRSGRKSHAALPALITGIGNRVNGLARWMGVEVQADWRAIKASAEALTVVQSTVEGETWKRASRRQGAIIGMEGFRGQAIIQGDLSPLLPLFVLGQVTHAGAHAALGMGRYQISGMTRI